MQAVLYIVATPIGNLEDITLRALRILKEVDQIACEDTRHTLKLLNHFEIHKPLVSYHEHNELTRAPELVLAIETGAGTALVTDAGHAVAAPARAPRRPPPPQACLAREVTKIHEEFRRGRLTELFQSLEAQPAKGEITLVIGAAEKAAPRLQVYTQQF